MDPKSRTVFRADRFNKETKFLFLEIDSVEGPVPGISARLLRKQAFITSSSSPQDRRTNG